MRCGGTSCEWHARMRHSPQMGFDGGLGGHRPSRSRFVVKKGGCYVQDEVMTIDE
jgi:hypothetical protein